MTDGAELTPRKRLPHYRKLFDSCSECDFTWEQAEHGVQAPGVGIAVRIAEAERAEPTA